MPTSAGHRPASPPRSLLVLEDRRSSDGSVVCEFVKDPETGEQGFRARFAVEPR